MPSGPEPAAIRPLAVPPRRILAARGGALGDFVVTLPCLAALRTAFPNAALHLLAHPAHAALAAADGLCDGTRSLESAGLAPFFTPEGEPGSHWREWFGSFDLVVSWLADRDGVFRHQVLKAGAGHFCQGPWHFTSGSPVSAQLASALTELVPGRVPHWHALGFCKSVRENTLAVHPGSGSARKNWPVSHWLDLLTAWQHLHPEMKLLVITGEAEPPEIQALPASLRGAGITCAHSHGAPLIEVCRLLAASRLYLGHDTGISHLAAACGTPGALIYGPASPDIWEPPTPHIHVCRTDDIPVLTPAEFLDFIKASRLLQ